MSLPKFLYTGTPREPLIPASDNLIPEDNQTQMSGSGLTQGAESESLNFQLEETSSFSTEPVHRFGNATTVGVNQPRRVLSSSPESRFTGEVGFDDPEVAAFAGRRNVGASYRAIEANGREPRNAHSLARAGAINSEPGDYVFYKHDQKRTKWEEATLYVREGEDNDKFLSHPTGKWSKMAYKILHHPVFYVFDLLLCIMLMLLALIERPAVFSGTPDDKPVVTTHGILEVLILLLLWLDIILRLIWHTPKHFFRHGRSVFITIMLCVMLVEAITVLIRQQSHVRVTRALRPVFFIDTYLMHGVRRVLRQIFQSLKEIVDIILLILFIIAFFALIAYYLFAEADPNYFKYFALSYVSLFITLTTANNPDVMMEAYSQHDASPLFFIAYLILTVYFASNVLLAVVYSTFAEEEKDKFRKLFLHKREALRHAFTVLSGSNGIVFHDFLLFMQHYKPRIPEWQVMCVFKALHTNREEEHTDLCLEEFYTFYEVQNLKWTQITEEGDDMRWFQHFTPKLKIIFGKIHRLVKWEWFNSIIHIVVLVNMLFLVIYALTIPGSEADNRFRRLNIVLPVSFLFLLVYIVENILKIIGLGPLYYFTRFWNLFDFILLSVSLVALCLELDPMYQFLAILRPIKLIRFLRLKKRYRDIMNTLVILTPRLLSVSLLLLVIYYFFAIIGMEFLQGQVYQGCCGNASYGVERFYADGRNGTSVNVYYLNNFDNLLRSYVTLFTLMVVNNWFIIMEGFASEVKHHWLARIYFMAFYIVTLVVLQVVISFIVEAFVLQLAQNNKRKKTKKICERDVQQFDDPDSVEDEKRKKEIRITLVTEDIKKLKYETTYIDETQSEHFSFDRLIRRWRRVPLKEMPETHGVKYSGRRLRNKDDIHLWQFWSDIKTWIQEQDQTFAQVESSAISKNPPLKEKAWNLTKKLLRYLLE